MHWYHPGIGGWGLCDWLVEGVVNFVGGGEWKAAGGVFDNLVMGCSSWI